MQEDLPERKQHVPISPPREHALSFVLLCHDETVSSSVSESKTRNVYLTLIKNEFKDKMNTTIER